MTAADAVSGEIAAGADRPVLAETTGSSRTADRIFEASVAPLVPLILRYFARRITPTDDAADCTDDALRAAAAIPAPSIPDEAFIAVEALKLVPARDQELIRLVVWEELSIAEAGRVLGIGAATACSRYSRALTRLREVYATLDS